MINLTNNGSQQYAIREQNYQAGAQYPFVHICIWVFICKCTSIRERDAVAGSRGFTSHSSLNRVRLQNDMHVCMSEYVSMLIKNGLTDLCSFNGLIC